MRTFSDAAIGIGFKAIESSSSEYNIHCNRTCPPCSVLTHICISHIPGGTIFDDNNPGITANWIPPATSPPGGTGISSGTYGAGVPKISASSITFLIVGEHVWYNSLSIL